MKGLNTPVVKFIPFCFFITGDDSLHRRPLGEGEGRFHPHRRRDVGLQPGAVLPGVPDPGWQKRFRQTKS